MTSQRAARRSPRDVAIGDKFKRLTVVGGFFRWGLNNDAWFPVQCECGSKYDIRFRSLGVKESCGCAQRESAINTHTKHGGSRTRLYRVWAGMLARCNNPKDTGYRWYGARGISVCEEWAEFSEFQNWAVASGYSQGLQLDRLDNEGNYSPANCRWVTPKQNSRNTRRNLMLQAWGESKCLSEWVDDSRCVVGEGTLRTRIGLGWNPEDAMSQPKFSRPYGRAASGTRRAVVRD